MTRSNKFALALLTATAAIASAALAPPPVLAGTYKVYSCKTPSGAPAPTDGWSATGHAPFSYFNNDCATGGSMRVVLGGISQIAGGSNVGWGFDSGGARIVDYTIHRSGTATATGHGTTGLLYSARQLNDPGGSRAVDYCATNLGCIALGDPSVGMAPLNRLHQSAAQLPTDFTNWFMTVGCGGYNGYPCNPLAGHPAHGSAHVHSAEFTLSDDDAPQADAVRGELATATTVSADATIAFVGSDSTSGIYRATIEVDGIERVALTPNTYGGRCARQGLAGGLNDFLHRRPCPTSQPVDMELPTSTLSDGSHSVRVRLFDAAGNATTVLGPRQIIVANGQSVAGSGAAARFEPASPATLRTSYGRRVAVAGRLVDRSGNPIAGASVEVHEQIARAGAPRRLVQTIQTDSFGRYRHLPAATASRTIELLHAPTSASLAADQIVKSRLLLRPYRRNVPAYGRLVLRGKIRSERSLRRVTVEIQARVGGSWRTVGVRRATVGGAFSYRYRLKRTANASFTFRARVRRSSDLPVIPQVSRNVRVTVGR